MSWASEHGGNFTTFAKFVDRARPLDRTHLPANLSACCQGSRRVMPTVPTLKGAAPFESVEENVTGFVSDISEGRHWEESEAQRKERLRRDYHCLFNALSHLWTLALCALLISLGFFAMVTAILTLPIYLFYMGHNEPPVLLVGSSLLLVLTGLFGCICTCRSEPGLCTLPRFLLFTFWPTFAAFWLSVFSLHLSDELEVKWQRGFDNDWSLLNAGSWGFGDPDPRTTWPSLRHILRVTPTPLPRSPPRCAGSLTLNLDSSSDEERDALEMMARNVTTAVGVGFTAWGSSGRGVHVTDDCTESTRWDESAACESHPDRAMFDEKEYLYAFHEVTLSFGTSSFAEKLAGNEGSGEVLIMLCACAPTRPVTTRVSRHAPLPLAARAVPSVSSTTCRADLPSTIARTRHRCTTGSPVAQRCSSGAKPRNRTQAPWTTRTRGVFESTARRTWPTGTQLSERRSQSSRCSPARSSSMARRPMSGNWLGARTCAVAATCFWSLRSARAPSRKGCGWRRAQWGQVRRTPG